MPDRGSGTVSPAGPAEAEGNVTLRPSWRAVRPIAAWIVAIAVLSGLFRVLAYDWYSAPAGSMKEVIRPGDILIVNRMAYGYSRHSCPWSLCSFAGRVFASPPERGDIVVFAHPRSGVAYVKRIVGLPGERIGMRGGVLHIDGEPVGMEPAGHFEEAWEPQGGSGGLPLCENRPSRVGDACRKRRYIETLPGGAAHAILDLGDGPADDTPGIEVPAGAYFVMGDHRDNSLDSRFPPASGGIGPVPFDNLIGRVDSVF